VTTETKVIVQGIQSRQDAQEKQAILDWLIDTNFGAQQSDVFAGRQPGTCQWLLNSSKYRNWVENGDQTLYCPGIPGAGKTILSSILINDLETKFEIDSTVGIAYIYCNFRNQQSQDIRMLVASVLKQLCQRRPDIPDAIQAMYRKHGMAQTKPPIEELRVALRAAVKLFSRVYLVVDALDEWQNTEGARSSMLNELLVLQAETHLNLFATSRPVGDIKRCFSGLPSIDISASQEDIALYVEGHQNLLPEFVGQTSGLLDKIKETLSEASQGM
jgi:Cdc6-like AAA superfamily ATPase